MRILEKKRSLSRRSLIGTVVVALTMAMALPTNNWAMIAPAQVSDVMQGAQDGRTADLKIIQTALESKILRQRLADFKLSPEQIDSRLSRLTDSQIHQAATQIQSVGPGGDGGGLIITVLVIAILVGVFMYVFKRV